MKVIILAAGRGKNLNPLTETRPKPMISICGKPVLEYIIRGLVETGNHDIIMVVGHHADSIQHYFESGERFGADIHYIHQQTQTGIGNAIRLAEDRIAPGERFLLVYADILFETNIFAKTLSTFRSKLAPVASITLTPKMRPSYGNVSINQHIGITKLTDQLDETQAGSYILAGVFVFDYSFFELLNANDGDMQMALDRLVQQQGLFGSIFDDEWIDLGYPWNVLDANHFHMKSYQAATIAKTVQFKGNVTINGPVQIQEGAVIEGGSVINGPCYIGRGTYVGNNVLIRENTSIGAECVIGFGVELRNCVLFDQVKVGRLSFIGDSVIGENVEIGPGIMTVNNLMTGETVSATINGKTVDSGLLKLGSFIGDNTKVGASNTLLPGTIIASGQMVPHHVSM
ncbi:NTP transferase domain-containing protein [candidate division KSB3 bacterium]|uniref:NTP transferase domain-containing protein n=1 Tax=candidate division KSB3 bacterium TaxID=2044937 RepID=A0A9D5JSB1_9BACT|nr:NTP transferase domain-containing protein [candidate division KSB3 bacterium]MBD3323076.1 NTP transferase domain-containing protein [candidate division KSB3 bacterium]